MTESDAPSISRQSSLSTTQKPALSRPPTGGMSSQRARPVTATGEKQCNVQVVVRCRPQNEREKREGETLICNAADGTEVHVNIGNAQKTGQLKSTSTKRTFTFDHVFNSVQEQAEVYNIAVKPLVEEVLAGFNCTVFAYGQTGTGKTHTMEGDITNTSDIRTKHAGVIPRSIHTIFDELQAANLDAIVKCSFMELYNEDLSDLLAERQPNTAAPSQAGGDDGSQLRLMESNEKGVIVQGLEEVVVRGAPDVFHLLGKAHARRRVAETLMNKNSSRSHCVFTITVSITEQSDEGEDVVRIGKLHLVDLAGSECVGRSGATAGRAVEAGNINKSLLTLGRVINALVEKSQHIPYRESKLTRLLQESLGGKAKTVIIATISPSSSSLDETLSTLDYAYRAKNIKNKPQVNEKKSGKTYMRELQSDIQALKKELEVQRQKNGIIIAQDMYDAFIANSKSSGIMISELEGKIKAKEEELAALEAKLLATQQQLTQTIEQRDIVQGKLVESEAVVVATKHQLHETEIVLDETKQNLSTTQTTLKHTQFSVDTHKYVIEQQCGTEEELTAQAQQLKAVTETVIDDKNSLHGKVDRLNTVAATNKDVTSTFEQAVSTRLQDGTATLGQQAQAQINNVNSMMDTVKQQTTAHNQHSDNLIMSLSNDLNTLHTSVNSIASSSREHVAAVDAHLTATAAQHSKFHTTAMDQSLLLQSAVATHGEKAAAMFATMTAEISKSTQQTLSHMDAANQAAQRYQTQLSTDLSTLNTTQQQHSSKQVGNMTNINSALQQFVAVQQAAAEEQSKQLFNSIQSLIESFKQQQVNAMTKAVTQFVSQLQSTIQTEQHHATQFGQSAGQIVDSSNQWIEQQMSAHQTCQQHINTTSKTTVEQMSSAGMSVQSSAASTDKAIEEIKALHTTQQTVVQTQHSTHQQYVNTLRQQHEQQVRDALTSSKQSVDRQMSTVQKHNQTVSTNAAEMASTMQQQILQINEQTNTASEFVNTIGQTVQSYVHQQLQHDKPTGTTPVKRKFAYPNEFVATAEHPIIKQSFADKHMHKLQTEPHVPYQPVYTDDEFQRMSVKHQAVEHPQHSTMSLAVDTRLPVSEQPSQVASPQSDSSSGAALLVDVDQENLMPTENVAVRSTRSRGKQPSVTNGTSSGLSKMKMPTSIPLANKSNVL